MADIKDTISALLARTEDRGATEAEAETAMRTARKLMRKHGLTADDIVNRTDACVDFAKKNARECVKRFNIVDKVLLNTIAEFTETVAFQHVDSAGTKNISFFGYRVDTELAAYIYSVCQSAVKEEWHKYRLRLDKKDASSETRAAFQIGMALRLKERLLELMKKDTTTGTDLIVLKNQLVLAAFSAATGTTSKENSVVEYDPSVGAFQHGFKVAGDVRFHREVASPLKEVTTS